MVLSVTGLALPRGQRRPLLRLAVLWLLATALLLGTRQVGGWPLLVAAGVALSIALSANQRARAVVGCVESSIKVWEPGVVRLPLTWREHDLVR